MRGILKKKRWICLAVMMIALQTVPGGDFVYGSSDIKGIEKAGDSITKTRKDGENFSFTSPAKAEYVIELCGPKAEGSGGGNGGNVSAKVVLEQGQIIDIYLGPGTASTNGARNGAKGNSASGYGDGGIYKSVISCEGIDIMTAAGGGSRGNPGAGDGSQASISGLVYTNPGVSCGTCGFRQGIPGQTNPGSYSHRHVYYNGVGGEGGAGGHGGTYGTNPGSPGSQGSAAGGWHVDITASLYYYAGGTGGQGGDGGASYANPLYCSNIQIAGSSAGESKVTITMAEEVLPPFDSKLILDMKREILEAILSLQSMPEIIPEITVIKGKAFDKLIPAYPDMDSAGSEGISVENADKTDKTIRVSGIFYTSGSKEIVIGGKTFVFHVITEPDSANVTVVFD